MSDLVENPNCWFSHAQAQISCFSGEAKTNSSESNGSGEAKNSSKTDRQDIEDSFSSFIYYF